MEIIFKSQLLADLYVDKKVSDKEFRSNPELIKQYIKTIGKLKSLGKIEQIYQFSGLNYEKLKGNKKGISSVRINKQYRLLFEEIKNKDEPFQVVLLEINEISKHYE